MSKSLLYELMCIFAHVKKKDMKTYQQLWQSLVPLYDTGEAQAIVRTLLDVKYGMSLTDIVCGKVNDLPVEEAARLDEMVGMLQKGEPVQYVLGQADFAGRIFHVEPGVLIPRPETAELCRWITEDCSSEETAREDCSSEGDSEEKESLAKNKKQILDICTGSGCIAITLALNMAVSEVTGWDISEDALRIAQGNVEAWEAKNVSIVHQDALNLPRDREEWDIIVSNPPYICDKEKAEMAKNVLDYEPDIALFVPDEDPLKFYRAIAQYAAKALKPDGTLYFEINPVYEREMREMLEGFGFSDIETKEDSFGKKRMMRAVKSKT